MKQMSSKLEIEPWKVLDFLLIFSVATLYNLATAFPCKAAIQHIGFQKITDDDQAFN